MVVVVDAAIAAEFLLARRLVVQRDEASVLQSREEDVRLVELIDGARLEGVFGAGIETVQRLVGVRALVEDEADDEEQRNADGGDDEQRDEAAAAASPRVSRRFG